MVDTLWYETPADLTTAKLELAITDTNDDTLLDDYGIKANRKIDNFIFPLLDGIPTTSEITNELKQAAILDVARRYKIKHKSFEAAKEYQSDFDEIITSVKQRAKATPTNRSKIVARSADYDTETALFSQTLR